MCVCYCNTVKQNYVIPIRARGVLTLPSEVRRRHRLDEPGALVALVERDDGVIELHPRVAVPANQAWFWQERWQGMEREVDEHVKRDELETHETADDFLQHLEGLADDDA